MSSLFKLSDILGIVFTICGGCGLYLSNIFESSAHTENAFLALLAVGAAGICLVILRLLWSLIIKLVYDLSYTIAKGCKDGRNQHKKTL